MPARPKRKKRKGWNANRMLEYLAGLGEMNPASLMMKATGTRPPSLQDVAGLAMPQRPMRQPRGRGWQDMLEFVMSQPGMLPVGATVYHGTPHRFAPTPKNPLGEFDMSKMGTGEGAQAYGHGMYVADSKGVAKSYSDNLARANDPRDFITEIVNYLHTRKMPTDKATLAREMSRYEPTKSLVANEDIMDDVARIAGGYDMRTDTYTPDGMASLRRLNNKLPPAPKGTLYKADLPDEHIANMLDWDAPLTQQPRAVRDVAGGLGGNEQRLGSLRRAVDLWKRRMASEPDPRMRKQYEANIREAEGEISAGGYGGGLTDASTGEQFYRTLSSELGAQSAASQYLGSKGVKGTKYYDQGSRAQGKGSRNYVVWQPDLLNILGME